MPLNKETKPNKRVEIEKNIINVLISLNRNNKHIIPKTSFKTIVINPSKIYFYINEKRYTKSMQYSL